MREIVLATSNQNKLTELRLILNKYHILSLSDIGFNKEIDENGLSFEENALIKARAVHHFIGRTVIADDSGLCVDALNGAPGIYSARYAGEHGDDNANNCKLLNEMMDIPDVMRTASFVSAGAIVFEDGSEYVVRGEVKGKIGFDLQGTEGFGYDPLFICDETNLRYSQMNMAQKNKISHRKRAFEKLKPIIDHYYETE